MSNKTILNLFLLHIFSIVIFIPVSVLLWLHLMFHPHKMNTYFLGLESILDIMNKKTRVK